MQILVFNGGSSSLQYKCFNYVSANDVREVFSGKAHRVGVKGMKGSFIEHRFEGSLHKEALDIPDHQTAAELVCDHIQTRGCRIDAIGHRFVHGGEIFKKTILINDRTISKMEECLPLAPLHNPISLDVIKTTRAKFSGVAQYAVFDSAFHAGIPSKAYVYPVAQGVLPGMNFRKYGFHGISYSYVSRKVAEEIGKDFKKANMILCHLGTGGASVAAVQGGRSIDTSMGFSPLSGLVMSTRSGDVDPKVITRLIRDGYCGREEVVDVLNKKSGLLGVCGFSSDLRDIIEKVESPQMRDRAQLALDMYIERLKKYIGSFIFSLGGAVDALVFTDDIGVNNALVRERACSSFQWAGIEIDKEKNQRVVGSQLCRIQSSRSQVPVLTVPTEEELIMCLEVGNLSGGVR